MHTTAYWITLSRELLASLPYSISERQDGMFGLLHALESVASLLMMCDRLDLGTTIGDRIEDSTASVEDRRLAPRPDERGVAREFFEPTLYLYDAYPGGIGMSEPLFHIHDLLIKRTRDLILSCPCEKGCPSCVGPVGETGERAKEAALAILESLSS
jgi:DEAD/DEAH box helicase domain-containing protein